MSTCTTESFLSPSYNCVIILHSGKTPLFPSRGHKTVYIIKTNNINTGKGADKQAKQKILTKKQPDSYAANL